MARTKHNVPVKNTGGKGAKGAKKSIASTLVGKKKAPPAAVKSPRNVALHKAATGPGIKKAYRLRPGTKALREIKRQQRDSYKKQALPKASINRLIREVAQKVLGERKYENPEIGSRWQEGALGALRESIDSIHSEIFKEAQMIAIYAGRITIMPTDIAYGVRLVNKQLAEGYKAAKDIPTGLQATGGGKAGGGANKSLASRLTGSLFNKR
jgi:histone H3/H4